MPSQNQISKTIKGFIKNILNSSKRIPSLMKIKKSFFGNFWHSFKVCKAGKHYPTNGAAFAENLTE